MATTWTDKDPDNSTIGRTPAQIEELITELRNNPGKWAVYSEHVSRGAARQRVHSLKSSPSYSELPMLWRTRRTEPGNVHAPVQVLVCWSGE